MNGAEVYISFAEWLDGLLESNDMPAETKAFCFNLYEESADDCVYSVQPVACTSFDENDPDWACDECWSSEEDIFSVELSDEAEKDKDAAQKLIKEWAEEYMANGKYSGILTKKPVGIGFVDGDLEIIHRV